MGPLLPFLGFIVIFGELRRGYFCPCWALHQDILGVRLRFKNFVGNYLCRLSTLVLEVQPYLIILIWPHLRVFLVLFRPLGAFFGLDLGLKTFLEPTFVVNQLWFWKYSPILLLLLRPNLGPFLPFLGLWGLFLGLKSGSKTFSGPTYID